MLESEAENELDVRAGDRSRVLIVDDSVISQRLTLRQIQKLGFEAEVASNGVEAINAIVRQDFAIVLLDCEMPEMDGYQTSTEIRRREQTSTHRTTIIALTANDDSDFERRCLTAGMDDYLNKPVNFPELDAKVRKWTASTEEGYAV